MARLKRFLNRWWMVLALVAFLPLFYSQAVANESSVDYVNNGFFTFWLSGQLVWSGGHPYSSAEWVAGHHANGATWIPNQIFPYPLPLSLITAPLGLLPIEPAYILWGVLSRLIVAASILFLSTFWQGLDRRLFALVIVVAVLLNGLNANVYLMLLTGTIGSLFLLFLTAALYFKHKGWGFLGGVALALLALKPPLLAITALIGLWLLLRRDWKTIAGMLAGGLALLLIGMIQDPAWVLKFRGASENLFNMRMGNQPTIISYTHLACNGNLTCALALYAVVACLLIGLYVWLIWAKRETLTALPVFSAAIALGVLLPPYIWSYDYVLLVIPFVYICLELIERTRNYLYPLLFLIVLDGLSLVAATLFSLTPESSALTIQRDMWSISVGLLVCVVCWGLVLRERSKNS